MGRNRDVEVIEELLLIGSGRRNSTEPDLSTVGGGQDNVRALERGELREGPGRREPGAAAVQQMFQRHPEPRWTPQNRPLIDTSKPATTGVATETAMC